MLSILSISTILTGCKDKGEVDPLQEMSKDELISYVRTLETESNTSFERIAELEELLRGIQGEDEATGAITEFSDGTGRLTLNSLDKMVQLPAPFEYPRSTQSYNASTVNITDNISVKPSSNWVVSLTGTQVEFEHTSSKISGIIKVSNVDKTQKRIPTEELTDYINEFFTSMPPETIKFSRVYVDSNWMGMDASAHTFINEEDAQLRCGMVGYGDICITYMFCYKGQEDEAKNELVLTLLQTMNIYTKALRVE